MGKYGDAIVSGRLRKLGRVGRLALSLRNPTGLEQIRSAWNVGRRLRRNRVFAQIFWEGRQIIAKTRFLAQENELIALRAKTEGKETRAEGKRQEGKGLRSPRQLAYHSKTETAEAHCGEVEAKRGAAIPRNVDPGATTLCTQLSIWILSPSAAIGRGSFIAVVPEVEAPFQDVSMHIV